MIILYVCLECQHVFDEDEIATWEEDQGEYWGVPCYEELCGCPKCGGSFVETYQCDSCDEWINGPYIKTDDDKRYCGDCYQLMNLGDE